MTKHIPLCILNHFLWSTNILWALNDFNLKLFCFTPHVSFRRRCAIFQDIGTHTTAHQIQTSWRCTKYEVQVRGTELSFLLLVRSADPQTADPQFFLILWPQAAGVTDIKEVGPRSLKKLKLSLRFRKLTEIGNFMRWIFVISELLGVPKWCR